MVDYLQAKSIHTFVWPFTFAATEKDMGKFEKNLEDKGWQKKELDYRKMNKRQAAVRERFMVEQYLSSSAKTLFLDEKNKVCEIFEYPLNLNDRYRYQIKTRVGNDAVEKTYMLPIEAIELHVYTYGIGLLFLKTLNMDKNTTIEDIKRINDKGRSISLPFLPDNPEGNILCAESLGIVTKKWEYITSFRDRVRAFYECGDESILEQVIKSADFLQFIINVNLDCKKENDIVVMPISDYRMFVFSLIRDKELSEKIKTRNEENYEEMQKLLYSVFFVDDGEASCQKSEMRQELLEKALYMRWADYGTVQGATNYSFICITSEDEFINSAVVQPFYVEYIYIVSLVLAQRIAILNFSDKADKVADYLHKNNKYNRKMKEDYFNNRWNKTIKALIQLQEDYIVLKNRLMMLEFSNQEQGIELYYLLQKQLLVEKEKEILDEQLQGLYDVVNTRSSSRSARWELIWAVVGIIISLREIFDLLF